MHPDSSENTMPEIYCQTKGFYCQKPPNLKIMVIFLSRIDDAADLIPKKLIAHFFNFSERDLNNEKGPPSTLGGP